MNKTKIIYLTGLILRISLIICFAPELQTYLFDPFIDRFLSDPSIDPWKNWLETGGRQDAFPYGFLMLFFFAIMGKLNLLMPTSIQELNLTIPLGLLFVEIFVWVISGKYKKFDSNQLALMYVFSLILIMATYVHGQLDLLPSALLFFGLIKLRSNNWNHSGLLIGIAISIKFSFILVLPLIFAFMLKNFQFADKFKKFVLNLLPGIFLTVLPILLPGYRQMVAETPQTGAIFKYVIPIGFEFYLVPLTVAYFVFLIWIPRRSNLDILFVQITSMLSILPLLMPSSPGWFIWGLLPLIYLSVELSSKYKYLVVILGFLETFLVLTSSSGAQSRSYSPNNEEQWLNEPMLSELPKWTVDSMKSFALIFGVFTLWRIIEVSHKVFDRYHMSKNPMAILIAGDSGSGKDTVCDSLSAAFGENRSSFILGDDYHLFERNDPNWEVKTHLNPLANDLPRFINDSLELITGNSVWSRHYDHKVGKFTNARQINKADFVIINGLHALTNYQLRQASDLCVFLDMDNNLRKALKVNRDVTHRKKNKEDVMSSIESRENDRNSYIQPQLHLADVVIRIQPQRSLDLTSLYEDDQELDLILTLNNLDFGFEFSKNISSIGNCYTNFSYTENPGVTKVIIHSVNSLNHKDIEAISGIMIQRKPEIFVDAPKWASGSKGLIQLAVILGLLERRSRRAISKK